jgi:hypothetical protein
MRRKSLAVVAVVAVLLLAIGVWCAIRRSEPTRPPELFGKVEAVRHSERGGTSFLVRSTEPNLSGWDSEQNAHHRAIDMPCWVSVRNGVQVRHRAGGPAEVAVGQTVSAWCSGPMAESMPPIRGGDFVVIEPDDR